MIDVPRIGTFLQSQKAGQAAVRVWVFELSDDEELHGLATDGHGNWESFRSARAVDVVEWAAKVTRQFEAQTLDA